MSRHEYTDDCDDDPLAFGRWRAQVASAIRGRRGQKLLRDLRDALDAMPEKKLIAEELVTVDGQVCALGAVGRARGVCMTGIDPEDSGKVAGLFDIAEPLAREIAYENDEYYPRQTPEQRWEYMRAWVESKLNVA